METITNAAILHNGVSLYTGRRHCDIIRDIVEQTGGDRVGSYSTQGFVTSQGRFVDRYEGARIALESGQIKRLKFNHTMLFSEDLW